MEGFKFPDEQEDQNVDIRAEGDDIEIEIVDDVPEKDRGRRPLDKNVEDPTEEELNAYSGGVKKRIQELTHARHDERRAKEATLREKEELERMAQALLEENKRLKQQYNEGAKQYAETANSNAEMKVENARKKLKEAQESFDSDAIATAFEELADAKAELREAKNFKVPPLQESEDVVKSVNTPPQPQIDERTLRWQAKNQWFGAPGYEDMTSFSLGLHKKLVNSGVDPRSDDYFVQVDARLRDVFPDFFGASAPAAKSGDSTKKPATVVAPGTRSTGAKKLTLTNTQLGLIKKYGLTPQQYAAEVLKLEKANG